MKPLSALSNSKDMNGNDILFKARIEEWLGKDKHSEAELAQGALMVLQCNRNRAMYNTIMRKPSHYEEKMVYELKKHLAYLQDGLNLDQVKALDSEVTAELQPVIVSFDACVKSLQEAEDENVRATATEVISALDADGKPALHVRGKREDHDDLPQEIQDIWPRNAERWKKIKQAFETCKSLDMACDRYEWLKILKEAWFAYKADMAKYDNYVIGSDDSEGQDKTDEQLSADDMKAISLARPYISKNLPKLIELKAAATDDASTKKYNDLLVKVQERVDVLLRTKQVITDDLRQQLADAGITLDTDEQGQEHIDDTQAAQ